MSNRLRGLLPAYRMGRLDEYIKLRFGSFDEYVCYCLRKKLYRIWQFQDRLSKLQAYPSYEPVEEAVAKS